MLSGGRPPPSWWVFSPTSLVVFPSSCSRSILPSPHLSLHPFPESFSPTIDLLSQPRAATKLSFPMIRPPPEPPPQNNYMAVMIVSPISNPKTMFQALSLMAAPPPSWLAPTRPPPEPPPFSSTTVKSSVSSDPDLCCPPPKPPWLFCCLIYFVLFDLCFSVCVLVCDFVFYVCCIVFWILYSCLVCIKCVCQVCFDVWYNIRCADLYEAAPDFISFAFYQLLLIRCDIVNKIETNYSRNARDAAKKMIRNWIERKTVDSHISFVNISGWTMLMHWLFGYGCWFKTSLFSANNMCNLHHVLVDYLSRIYSLKLLGNALSILTLALCNIVCFME